MAPISNARVIFNKVPTGYPVLGETLITDTSETIDLEIVKLGRGVLVKTLVLSVDPYFRRRMRTPEQKSYSAPFPLGETIPGYGVAKVLRSESDSFAAGDHVYGIIPFAQYSVLNTTGLRVLKNEEGVPWSAYIGILGMPGKTAYYGLKEHAEAKQGETLFVSTGAGPVGSLVAQLAKAKGLKVIASAGSDDKVEFMKSIGVDVPFNYKTTSTRDVLKEHGPVAIYWDHVGGETLEAALDNMSIGGRIVIVGAISGYNSPEPYGIKNTTEIMTRRLTVKGHLVSDHESKYSERFYTELPPLIKSGKLQYREHITKGLENAERALLDVLKGNNFGKAVVVVAED